MINLSQALRLGASPALAFVGAGGKTTAMFQLAKQLPAPVLATATTHLGTWQLNQADQHIVLSDRQDWLKVKNNRFSGVTLITGDIVEPERVAGLSFDILHKVFSLAEQKQLPLLIEADGSRQLPLKAPGEHEPAIPPFVKSVVVVAGLSALGKPLLSDWVHRVRRFSKLSGVSIGEELTTEAILNVLASPAGGLKNIPAKARRQVLLNQADTQMRQASANTLARKLLPQFHSAIISALDPPGQNRESWPSLQSSQGKIFAVHENIAGIILAAGESSRLGQPKQLLHWKNEPLVFNVAKNALSAGLSPVTVVTGAYADQVEQVVAHLPVGVVYNPDWECGQSTSVNAGLRSLPAEVGAAVFMLSDQPQIPSTLVRKIVEIHAQTLAPIVAPMIDDQRGNPVLFDRVTFPDFLSLKGDVGGRRLFSRYPVTWVEWHDRNLLLDVDTEEDYQRLLELGG